MDNKDVLGKIWGDAPRGTQGKGPEARGVRAVRAAKAGIVAEMPVPQDVQAVFDKMKPKNEKQSDRHRTNFLKKYHVDSEGVAHLTPEEFRDMIYSAYCKKNQFQNHGVDRIFISNDAGVEATFVFLVTRQTQKLQKCAEMQMNFILTI